MLHYYPRHGSSINPLNAELNPICHLIALLGGATIVVVSRLRVNMPFFRRTNCIHTASGIVTLCTVQYSMPDESRLQSSPLSSGIPYSRLQSVTIPDAVIIQFVLLKMCMLTLNLLTTTIVAPPSNASKWQMGFNSAFKGLMLETCRGL